MKLYKFRPLTSCEDFERVQTTLETGRFWCSSFIDLNDPMEGVFNAVSASLVQESYSKKMKYKICSFSGEGGFQNPSMWGYYAAGFRGVAIEIEIAKNYAEEVDYDRPMPSLEVDGNGEVIKEILTTKLKCWEHEKEWRYLREVDESFQKIGRLKALYFGDPYSQAINKNNVYKESLLLQKYKRYRDRLIAVAKEIGINPKSVVVDGGNVKAINLIEL